MTQETETQTNHVDPNLLESFSQLWSDIVDESEPYFDADGTRWAGVGATSSHGQGSGPPYANEQQLADIRAQCRALATGNEFAINGHENRINYIVGTGHAYRVVGRDKNTPQADVVPIVQAVLDEFLRENRWHQRQQEIVRRRDRDGEAFLRLFVDPDGKVRVRFVEPDQIAAPPSQSGDPTASFGVRTDPDDVETPRAYCIDGRWIPSVQIQHRKGQVDANVKRGLPLFYPVRANLRRAEKLLRNMSVVAEIQSAIAIIRKHQSGTQSSVQRFAQNQADATATDPTSGRTHTLHRYAPGTILDAFAGTEYQFPASAIDAGSYVTVLQAELRAIAARLVMPEFMLSSDASNASYASTMVAEGPAVRMFQRLQQEMLEDDLELLWYVVDAAVAADRLPETTRRLVDIQGVPPTLSVRDRLKETQADQILLRNKVMSPQTMAMRHGLDPEKEERLMADGGKG